MRLWPGNCLRPAYVDGLLLPNGVRCPEDDEGRYLCP
jgi:hypothetical protein